MNGRTRRLVLGPLVVLFLLAFAPAFVHASGQPSVPKVVPTTTCLCQPSIAVDSAAPRFKGPPQPPSNSAYDEQLGMTFTQSFTSLEYNVTAVIQTDTTLDTGPAYLLNGLSNNGYWYQVGVSWNWSPGQTPGTGFDMNYEVFDPAQNSIFPTSGGGGVQAFSGSVNDGDLVTLNLYFKSPNTVVMQAEDVITGAFASVTYSAEGATYFTGSPSAVANSNGYFTGLMNEWYHGNPFYANGKQVTFSDPQFALISAWMWMDEFNANTLKDIFSSTTPSPVSYSNPNSLQKFSYNGTLEFSDAYEFMTGNATSTNTNSTVSLTFSYSVLGGGSGYQPPVLIYSLNGVRTSATLQESQIAYKVDLGSTWNVSPDLNGSSSSERWQTDQATTGVAKGASAVSILYYHQFLVSFGFTVDGGGSGYQAPMVAYLTFGSGQTAEATSTSSANAEVWADSGSRYNYTDPLSGSTTDERWNSGSPSGSVGAAGAISAQYHHQFLLTVDASFTGSEIFPSVSIKSTSAGSPFTGTVVLGPNPFWLDANAQYTIPQTLSLSQGERWATNATTSGAASGGLTIHLGYQYQYFISFSTNAAGGGTISATSGWYPPDDSLQVTATTSPGWEVVGWAGTGSGSNSGTAAAFTLVVSGPANETATFYPGVTLRSAGPITVSYQDGSISGTVPSGGSAVVYVPPASAISLTTSPPPFLYLFSGWSGASNSTGKSISLVVNEPESVLASSTYNYTDIAIIVAAVLAILVGALLAARRPRSQPATDQKEAVGSPAA
jgi:hypothetical protein